MIVINQLPSNGILRILDNLSSVTYYEEVRRITFEKGWPVANPCLPDQQLNFLSQSWHRREHQVHCTLLGFHSNNPPQMDFAPHHPTLWDHGGAPSPKLFQYSNLIFWPCLHFNVATKSVWAWFPTLWNELNSRHSEPQKSLHAKSSSSLSSCVMISG